MSTLDRPVKVTACPLPDLAALVRHAVCSEVTVGCAETTSRLDCIASCEAATVCSRRAVAGETWFMQICPIELRLFVVRLNTNCPRKRVWAVALTVYMSAPEVFRRLRLIARQRSYSF